MATETAPPEAPPAEPKKRGFKFPTAFTVLFFVLIIVWLLTFIIKPGSYDYVDCGDSTAKPVPGSYHSITVDTSFGQRLYDLWLSPVNGLYGLQPSQPSEDENGAKLKAEKPPRPNC